MRNDPTETDIIGQAIQHEPIMRFLGMNVQERMMIYARWMEEFALSQSANIAP